MTHSLWRRCFVAAVLVAALVLSGTLDGPAAAGDTYQATLDYMVDPGAYDNSVEAANASAIRYPRIVVDRNVTSPYAGTVYVLGLQPVGNGSCSTPAVVRSLDGGKTFDAPHVANLCLPGLTLDPVVARDGTLYAAAWGPRILRSTDAGLTWTILATLGDAAGPASLTTDAVTGGLFVAWVNASWPGSGDVFVRSSWDGGLTWLPPVHPLAAGIVGASPQLAVFGTAAVLSVVATNASGPFVAAVTSQDGGTTWPYSAALTPVAYCNRFSAPSVAVSPGGLFAVSWYADPAYAGTGCWDTMGNTTEIFVSLSSDRGRTFSEPRLAGGPPGFPTESFGDAVAFDDASRLYVTWHAIQESTWNGTVYVAGSADLAETFDEANFSTRLQVSGGNSTAQENLAAGLNGTVFLVWVVLPVGSLGSGVYVRAIAGEASGTVDLSAALASAPVTIELRDNRTGGLGARMPWTGGTVSVQGLVPSLYNVSVQVNQTSVPAGTMPIRTWGRTAFSVRVNVTESQVTPPPVNPPPNGGPSGTSPWPLLAAAAVGLLGSGAILASLLHTRLVREEALQRKVRLLMFEYVRDHPGASFSEVRHALGLENGVAAYHLQVLEKLGLVHSESHRRHRWYYPNGDVSLWRELPLSPLQATIVEAVRKEPGIGVRELSRRTGRRASSIGYNVKALARDGVILTNRENRKVRCFPGDRSETT